MTNGEKKPEINILVPEKSQSAIFSNIAQVNATEREVIIDFAFIQPNTNQGIIVSKIALTPKHAIALRDALNKVLERYAKEEKTGN